MAILATICTFGPLVGLFLIWCSDDGTGKGTGKPQSQSSRSLHKAGWTVMVGSIIVGTLLSVYWYVTSGKGQLRDLPPSRTPWPD
jgi:hypothetical protein